MLKDDYEPGDLGFDPLGLCPRDDYGFSKSPHSRPPTLPLPLLSFLSSYLPSLSRLIRILPPVFPNQPLDSFLPSSTPFTTRNGPVSPEVMRNRELQNGRLAMIGSAGMVAQELVDGKGILDHFGLAPATLEWGFKPYW